jgi:hypothetical protein
VFAGMMPGSVTHALLDHAPYPRSGLRTRSDQGQSGAGCRLVRPPGGRQHPKRCYEQDRCPPVLGGLINEYAPPHDRRPTAGRQPNRIFERHRRALAAVADTLTAPGGCYVRPAIAPDAAAGACDPLG